MFCYLYTSNITYIDVNSIEQHKQNNELNICTFFMHPSLHEFVMNMLFQTSQQFPVFPQECSLSVFLVRAAHSPVAQSISCVLARIMWASIHLSNKTEIRQQL